MRLKSDTVGTIALGLHDGLLCSLSQSLCMLGGLFTLMLDVFLCSKHEWEEKTEVKSMRANKVTWIKHIMTRASVEEAAALTCMFHVWRFRSSHHHMSSWSHWRLKSCFSSSHFWLVLTPSHTNKRTSSSSHRTLTSDHLADTSVAICSAIFELKRKSMRFGTQPISCHPFTRVGVAPGAS